MRTIIISACWLGLLGCVAETPPAAPPSTAKTAESPPKKSVAAAAAEGKSAYAAKDYTACGEAYETAAAAAETRDASSHLYDAACCHALAGKDERAIQALLGATDRGYRDIEHLKRDADLERLHTHPRWNAVVGAAQAKFDAYLATLNIELYELFKADQKDRSTPAARADGTSIVARDNERRARVREILDAQGAKVAADYFHAAMVFQHGNTVADFQMSHQLALKAAELDPTRKDAKWLAAASKDRELMNLGKPQLYGTQFRKTSPTSPWELYEVDPSVTDEERAKWNVPPLAEARKRLESMNAVKK